MMCFIFQACIILLKKNMKCSLIYCFYYSSFKATVSDGKMFSTFLVRELLDRSGFLLASFGLKNVDCMTKLSFPLYVYIMD